MGMTLRFAMAVIASFGLSLTLAYADGMPDPENYNPVPSIPGVPAPGVSPKPEKPKPAPAPAAEPAPAPAPAAVEKPVPAPEPPPPPPPAAAPTPTPAASPAPAQPPAATTTAQKKTILEIRSVDIQIAERKPPFITVTVRGTTKTGGWKDFELRPLPTLAKEVGMLSYTLVATPPSGVATQVLTPVIATMKIDPIPDDVKTIRVLGETNEVAQNFR
jgi:hypothetical protein